MPIKLKLGQIAPMQFVTGMRKLSQIPLTFREGLAIADSIDLLDERLDNLKKAEQQARAKYGSPQNEDYQKELREIFSEEVELPIEKPVSVDPEECDKIGILFSPMELTALRPVISVKQAVA